MSRRICVYCSSSNSVDTVYLDAADELGKRLAANGDELIYGGANVGSMGRLAEQVHQGGGRVVGIIPEYLAGKGLDFQAADELIVVPTMSERKMAMAERAEAFFILPGGFGTLEELLEILTLKQLHYHQKAIIVINIDGFYDPLLAFFQELVDLRFTIEANLALLQVVNSVDDALAALDCYEPPAEEAKWL